MKVQLVIDNDDLDAIVVFDDGVIAIAEEKCWLLIGGDGAIIERTWKEEPQSDYYKEYARSIQGAQKISVPRWGDNDTISPFSSIVFALTRLRAIDKVND